MTRFPDWPERLATFVQMSAQSPFAWQTNDCCTFAAAAVMAITGGDPMADLRGTYSDEEGARALIAAEGGLTVIVTVRLGEPLAARTLAQRGDVVLYDMGPYGEALGICLGAQFVAAGADGAEQYSMRHVRTAWRIA
jgi:hypothetical protein